MNRVLHTGAATLLWLLASSTSLQRPVLLSSIGGYAIGSHEPAKTGEQHFGLLPADPGSLPHSLRDLLYSPWKSCGFGSFYCRCWERRFRLP